MKTLRTASFLLTTLMLSVTAGAQTAPPSPPKTPSGPAAPAVPDVPPVPEIKLIDAGTGTQKALRYAPVKDAESTFRLVMTATTTMKGMEQAMPELTTVFATKVLSVNADGTATYSFTIRSVTSDDPPNADQDTIAKTRKGLESLAGTGGKITVSSRGVLKAFESSVPTKVNQGVNQQMDDLRYNFVQYCAAFPEEPVGTGAKWQVTQSITRQGLKVDQTTTITLKALSGSALELALESTQSAPEQDMGAAGGATGTKPHLKSLKGKGSGASTVVLSSLFPESLSNTKTSDMELTVPQLGEMTTHSEMSVEGESVEAAPAKKAAP